MSLPEQLGDNALAWARLVFSSKPRILEKLDTIQIKVSISFSLIDDIITFAANRNNCFFKRN